MAKFGFTYMFTQDLSASKAFYADTLGLDFIWDEAAFSKQLGWQGGVLPKVSGSIAFGCGEFSEVVERLLVDDTIAFFDEPQWVGYWTFPVLDPMNQTIEITGTDEAGYGVGLEEEVTDENH